MSARRDELFFGDREHLLEERVRNVHQLRDAGGAAGLEHRLRLGVRWVELEHVAGHLLGHQVGTRAAGAEAEHRHRKGCGDLGAELTLAEDHFTGRISCGRVLDRIFRTGGLEDGFHRSTAGSKTVKVPSRVLRRTGTPMGMRRLSPR